MASSTKDSMMEPHSLPSNMNTARKSVSLLLNLDDLQVSPGNPELETVKSSRDNGTNGLPNRLPDPSALHCLPGELHLKIFDLLDDDPETSACLGLTCKKLYPIFVALLLKPKLLREFCIKCEERRHPGACDLDFHRSGWKTLKELLIDWNPQIDDV